MRLRTAPCRPDFGFSSDAAPPPVSTRLARWRGKVTRYSYNQQLTPAAPFVHVTLRRPIGGVPLTEIPAQLDSGADISVLPWSVVESLGLAQLDQLSIMGFGGHVTLVPVFLVGLGIRQLDPFVIRVLGIRDEPYLLLGRDVLNRYRLLLDGPGQTLQID